MTNKINKNMRLGALLGAIITLCGCGAPRPILYNSVEFSGERERKAVSIPAYSGDNKILEQKFIEARGILDQGLLKSEIAGKMTGDAEEAIKKSRELYISISNDSGNDHIAKAAAAHGASMTSVILREYDSALTWAQKAKSTDPEEVSHSNELHAIKTGFYQKRYGYVSKEVSGPVFSIKSTADNDGGLIASVDLLPARIAITQFKTIVSTEGFVWTNGVMPHKVHYEESAQLQDSPLVARIVIKNSTERVARLDGTLIQAYVNGSIVAADIPVKWDGDISRIPPGSSLKGHFGFGSPSMLPESGEIKIKIIDLPKEFDAAGVIAVKKNSELIWSIGSISNSIDLLNFDKEEDINQAESAKFLGKTRAVDTRHVKLIEKVK